LAAFSSLFYALCLFSVVQSLRCGATTSCALVVGRQAELCNPWFNFFCG
jgi:hypothetical protein